MRPESPLAAPHLLENVSRYARELGGETALVFVSRGEPDVQLSWAVDLAVRRLGGHLQERGIAPGDVTLVLAAAPGDQILGFLGAMACGGIPSILSFPSVKQSEARFLETLATIAGSSRTRWILASREMARVVAGWAEERGAGVLELPDPSLPGRTCGVPPAGDRPLFLQFSSGTTGARKGIAVSREMFVAQALAYGVAMDLGPADRIANWLPLYHDNGLVGCFLLPMYLGACSIHLAPFDWVEEPVAIFQAVDRYRATLLWSPNFAFSFCARRIAPEQLRGLRFDSLRAFLTGGELVRESSRRELLERFAGTGLKERHLQVCYGMAENTFVATQTAFGSPVRREVVDRRTFFQESRAAPLASGARPEEG